MIDIRVMLIKFEIGFTGIIPETAAWVKNIFNLNNFNYA